jgi:hypothetical protein
VKFIFPIESYLDGSDTTDQFYVSYSRLSGAGEFALSMAPIFYETNTGEVRSTVVPAPSTTLLLACGLAGLAAMGRRRSVH